ncbi:MAG: hypothetical protein M3680_21880, partial [Myxococcota bacterium]|nr:hypothetical protein [Myxococcota bacterium]
AKPARTAKAAQGAAAAPPIAAIALTPGTTPATEIGYLDGGATAFWVLCGDASTLTRWRGEEGSSVDANATDFARALDAIDEDGTLEIGEGSGVAFEVGECGGSIVWQLPDGVAVWAYGWGTGVDRSSPDVRSQLGARVAGLPTQGEPRHAGTVTITSGCLALLVPFAAGCTAEQVEAVIASGAPHHVDQQRVLVPLSAGDYDILDERLAPPPAFQHADDLGRYRNRVRIVLRQAS